MLADEDWLMLGGPLAAPGPPGPDCCLEYMSPANQTTAESVTTALLEAQTQTPPSDQREIGITVHSDSHHQIAAHRRDRTRIYTQDTNDGTHREQYRYTEIYKNTIQNI